MEYAFGLLRLLRARNTIGAIIGACGGLAVAHAGASLRLYVEAATILVLLNGFATIQNDISDQVVDKANKRTSVLLSGEVPERIVALFGYLTVAAACLVAVASERSTVHAAFILVFFLMAWVYNRSPFMASRRPIASITVLACCTGFVPVLYGMLLAGRISILGLVLAFAFWLQRAGLNLLKDFKDEHGDRQHNKQTFLIRYGRSVTLRASVLCQIFGFCMQAAVLMQARVLSGLLLMPFVAYATWHRRSLFQFSSNSQLSCGFERALLLQNVIDAGVVVCLLIS